MSEIATTDKAVPELPSSDPAWAWFHIIFTTYGAWLYGDSRGFRTRHHREHVQGDYKNRPAAGLYADKEARSRRLLKQEPVEWAVPWRPTVGEALVERLRELGAFVLCAAVSRQHVHLLAKLPKTETRNWCGLAKKHAWFTSREQGWVGKMWGKRGKATPVRDRQHQLNAYRYILDHIHEGAWVWRWEKPQG